MTEPKELLSREELMADHLQPFEGLIKSTSGFFEKQVMTWSIVHYVPLQKLKASDVCLVFYEELVTNPERELERISSKINAASAQTGFGRDLIATIRKPSRVSHPDSPVNRGGDLLSSWKDEVRAYEMRRGLEILHAFGLDEIYSDALMPDRKAAERLLSRSNDDESRRVTLWNGSANDPDRLSNAV